MAYYIGNQQYSSNNYTADAKKKAQQEEEARKKAAYYSQTYGGNNAAVSANYRKDYGQQVKKASTTKLTPVATQTAPEAKITPAAPSWTAPVSAYQQYQSQANSPTYAPSADLQAIWDEINQSKNNKPGEYQSSYSEQIDALLKQIENRKDFSYDASEDPLYDIYKEQYQQSGQLAMQDSMGAAAALTGGYGSSYGQQVGQQTYQAHMQELNAKIPELAASAYQQYQQEGAAMFDKMGLYQGLDAADYAKYTAEMDDYYQQLGVLMNQYSIMSNEELARYQAELAAYQSDRDYQYALQQAAIEQSNFDKQFAYQQQQDALDQSNWERQFSLSQSKSSGSGSSAKNSTAYKDVVSALSGINASERSGYIQSIAQKGYITPEEETYIQSVIIPGLGKTKQDEESDNFSVQDVVTVLCETLTASGSLTKTYADLEKMYANKYITADVKKAARKSIDEIYRRNNGRYK